MGKRPADKTCLNCGHAFVGRWGKPNTFCATICERAWDESRRSIAPCPTCASPVISRPGLPRKYCSVACRGLGRRNQAAKVCQLCGKEFTALKSLERVFCSNACYHASKKKTVMSRCVECRREFVRKKGTTGKYCSLACSNHTRKGILWGKSAANAALPLQQIQCPICGKPHKTIPSRPRKYCSLDCYKEARARRVTKSCLLCNCIFKGDAKGKYCSYACFGKALHLAKKENNLVYAVCPICSKTFSAKSWANRIFCSQRCSALATALTGAAHPNWKGGGPRYYGDSWPAARRAVVKRDKVCQDCGCRKEQNGRALSVHHIKAFRFFGVERHLEANALDNLVLCCNSCHTRREWIDGGMIGTAPNPRNQGPKKAIVVTRYTFRPR